MYHVAGQYFTISLTWEMYHVAGPYFTIPLTILRIYPVLNNFYYLNSLRNVLCGWTILYCLLYYQNIYMWCETEVLSSLLSPQEMENA